MSRLFRKSFLLGLRENSDDLALTVPNRHVPLFWPTMFTVAFALAVLAGWLFTAKLPVTVEARGVVMPLGGVREVVSFGQGMAVNRLGSGTGNLQAGDVLLKVTDPTAEAAYEDARQAFKSQQELILSHRQASEESHESRMREMSLQLDRVRAKLARLHDITTTFETAVAEYDATEREMLEAQRQANVEVKNLYDEMEEGAEELWEKRFATIRDYAGFQQSRTSAMQSLANIITGISQSKIEKQRMLRELSELQDEVASSVAKEQEILGAIKEARGKREIERRQLKLQEIENRNKLLDAERRLWLGSHIFSPYDGELVAMKKSPGQLINKGESVALINMTPQHRKLMLVLSSRARGGQIGFSLNGRETTVTYSPETKLFQNRLSQALQSLAPSISFSLHITGSGILISSVHGQLGILENLEVSQVDLTDDAGVPVFAVLFAVGDEWTSQELSTLALIRPQDAKRVREGQRALVKPDFEKSLIGTQVEARVLHVSNYVATSIESQSFVGSEEMAKALAGETGGVTVLMNFERDLSGKLRLDGDALSRPLSIGTMSTIRVQVEEASPIEVLLPFYADLFN